MTYPKLNIIPKGSNKEASPSDLREEDIIKHSSGDYIGPSIRKTANGVLVEYKTLISTDHLSIVLNSCADWRIYEDSFGRIVLVPTKKDELWQ